MPTSFSSTTRSLAYDSAKYALLAWFFGGLLLAGWLSWFVFAKITVYEISSKARLEVNHSAHPIAASVAGKIVSISLTLGQMVQQGDVLLELDTRAEKLRLQEEQARSAALPSQIASLERQIVDLEKAKTNTQRAAEAAIASAKSRQKEAELAAEFAKDNERRLTRLSHAVPQMEILRARSESEKLSSAQEALASDVHRLQMEAQTQPHQKQAEIENLIGAIAKLKGDIDTAQKTIARLKQDIDQHVLRAPASGQIGDIVPLQVGTYIAVGEKLGTVVPHSELRIVADFPPASVLGRIHPGQFARMRLDGFPWAQFGTITAKVSRVGSEIHDNHVQVEFTPTKPEKSLIALQHGLPGSIEVSIEQVSPAVMVLRNAGQLLSRTQSVTGDGKP